MPLTPDFEFLPLGAIIQSFFVPTPTSSSPINIVQSFPSASLYQAYNQPFFGETIGRVANRVSDAKINSLNGTSYSLLANNGVNALHGGKEGWGKRVWQGPKLVGVRQIPGVEGLEGGESVQFSLRDENGKEGYPGTVDASVVYTTGLLKEGSKEVRVLGIEYEVKLVDDGSGVEETAVNVTNHSYFNLTGKPTIEGTDIILHSTHYLPVDDGGIPNQTIEPYSNPVTKDITAGTPFTLGPEHPNVDDCFIVDPSSEVPLDTRSSPLKPLVTAYHPESKIHLEVLSTEPAFQFYTGKYIDVPAVEGVPARGPRSGFCVEPSRYVNAVNVPEWRSQVVLKRGEVYGSRIVYKGWSDAA